MNEYKIPRRNMRVTDLIARSFLFSAGFVESMTPSKIFLLPLLGLVICLAHASAASAYVLNGGTAPQVGPAPGEKYTALAQGLFEFTKTDLTVAAPMQISVTRVYRSQDIDQNYNFINRDFGYGMRLSYDIFLTSNSEIANGSYTDAEVNMPDGGSINCTRSSSCSQNGCTDYTDATFICAAQPTGVWFGSTISYSTSIPGWQLKRKDGMIYNFGLGAPLQSIQDRYENSITISHSGGQTGQILQVTSSNGRYITFGYTDSNNPTDITSATDNSGRVVAYTYDTNPKLFTVTQNNLDPTNAWSKYDWGTAGTAGDIVDVKFNVKVGASGPNVNYVTYNSNEQMASISSSVPSSGDQYVYSYDPSGTFIQTCKVLLPDSGKRLLTFNAQGYIVADARDYNDIGMEEDTTFSRDGNNNLLSVTAPLTSTTSRTVSYVYDSLANVTSVTHTPGPGTSSSATTNYSYEPVFSRIASITEPLTPATTFTYNDTSASETLTDPMGRTTTVNFNPVTGQVTSVKDNLGNTSTFAYNSSTGDEMSATDPLGNTTSFTTDAIGRVTQVESPLGGFTKYTYDAINDVLSVTDPNNSVTNYQYDLIGDKVQITDPNDNVTTITIPVTMDTITTCDAANNCTVENLDAMGRKTTFTDKRGVKTGDTYDKLGRLISVAFNQNGVSGFDQRTLNYAYNMGDQLTSITDSEGPTLSYQFDGLDNITSETTPAGTVTYTYDANGRRTSIGAPLVPEGNSGNYQVSYSYFNDDELQTVTMPGVAATFTPDGDGRRGSLAVNNTTTTYGYDAASRLTSLAYAYNSTSLGNLTYTYDKNSDLVDVGGSLRGTNLPGAATATYTNTNQVNLWDGVASVTDAASNLTTDPSNGEGYSWDSRNMLSSLTKGGTMYSYSYDATGRRLTANNAGNTTSYSYDGDALIGSVLAGVADNYLNVDGEVLADANSSAISIPLVDGSGSTIALVNSATGSLSTQYTYDPAGNVKLSGQPSSFPFLGGGAQYDSLTGLYAGEGNYYNPVLERAISLIGATQAGGSEPGLTGSPGETPSGGLQFGFNISPQQQAENAGGAGAAGALVATLIILSAGPGEAPPLWPAEAVALAVEVILDFSDLFGSSHPWINPKLYQPSHPPEISKIGSQDQAMGDNTAMDSLIAAAYHSYPSIQDAAKAAQPGAVKESQKTHLEAYGFIYKAAGGGYEYNGPFDSKTEEGGWINIPRNAVATYHTHPPEAIGFPSPNDIKTAYGSGIPGFIFTVPPNDGKPSDGGIFEYGPGVPDGYEWVP